MIIDLIIPEKLGFGELSSNRCIVYEKDFNQQDVKPLLCLSFEDSDAMPFEMLSNSLWGEKFAIGNISESHLSLTSRELKKFVSSNSSLQNLMQTTVISLAGRVWINRKFLILKSKDDIQNLSVIAEHLAVHNIDLTSFSVLLYDTEVQTGRTIGNILSYKISQKHKDDDKPR